MFKYKLKNKEQQAALEKAFPGFDSDLQAACDDEFDDEFDYVRVRLSHDGGILRGSRLNIEKAAICAKEVYDHNKWNNYPEVTPPEKIWMRIEMLSQDGGIKTRDVAFYKAGRWCKFPLDNGEVILGRLRFRPFDDEEAAK